MNPRNPAQAYASSAPGPTRAQLDEHLRLVRRIAGHIACKLPPSVPFEELVQAGSLGLAQALPKWNPSVGTSFESYAGSRIRGAILDWLRQEDALPKGVRKEAKDLESAIRTLRSKLGREPREDEIAEAAGYSLEEFQALTARVDEARHVSVEDLGFENPEELFRDQDPMSDPMQALAARQAAEALSRYIDELPEKERLILSLYHEQELTFKEIGLILSLTEARICQLYGQACLKVKSRFAKHVSGDAA